MAWYFSYQKVQNMHKTDSLKTKESFNNIMEAAPDLWEYGKQKVAHFGKLAAGIRTSYLQEKRLMKR